MPEDIEKKIAGDVSETSSCDASVEGKLLEIQNEVYGISGKFVTLGQKDILKPVSLATPGAMSIPEESTSGSAFAASIDIDDNEDVLKLQTGPDHKRSKTALAIVTARATARNKEKTA